MINFKNKDEVAPSALILLAVLVLLGSLVVKLAVRPPTVAGLTKGRERSRLQIEKEIRTAKERAQEDRGMATPRLWQGDPEQVTAEVLAQLTQGARGGTLKMAAFRPQKMVQHEALTELPFTVQLSGSYGAVRGFIAALDRPGSKLALRSLQVAAGDGASDAVTATLWLSAFIERVGPAEPEPTKAKGGSRG